LRRRNCPQAKPESNWIKRIPARDFRRHCGYDATMPFYDQSWSPDDVMKSSFGLRYRRKAG
jgi:hypothetical protein